MPEASFFRLDRFNRGNGLDGGRRLDGIGRLRIDFSQSQLHLQTDGAERRPLFANRLAARAGLNFTPANPTLNQGRQPKLWCGATRKIDYLKSMNLCRKAGVCAVAALLGASATHWAKADAKANPYESIVARNVFALKPPPPPPDPTPPPPPPAPLAKVVLTGITSIFGESSKRAIVEITEQEAGKAATVKKPILREGERDGSIEVVSIDVEKSIVRIRNGGVETNLIFEVQKSPAGPPAPSPLPGAPGAPMTAGFNPPHHAGLPGATPAANPAGIASPYSANSSGSGGITILSGGNSPVSPSTATPAGNISVPAYVNPNTGLPSVSGGIGVSIPTIGGAAPENAGRVIPSRPIRTENTAAEAPGPRVPVNLPGGFPPLPPIGELPSRRQSQ